MEPRGIDSPVRPAFHQRVYTLIRTICFSAPKRPAGQLFIAQAPLISFTEPRARVSVNQPLLSPYSVGVSVEGRDRLSGHSESAVGT